MGIRRLVSNGLILLTVAQALAGCGGSSPLGGPIATQPESIRRTSWMKPDAKRTALLYISVRVAGKVLVYSYPNLVLTVTLTGFLSPSGLCVNSKTRNIWVTDTLGTKVSEFAHGGTTPIRTLSTNDGYVDACAVNPKNGDLAVANNTLQGSDPGDLMVFKNGNGSPKIYSDPQIFLMDFVSYDGSGNVFIDGYAFRKPHFRLDELVKGAKGLSNIPWLGPKIKSAGGVQYDGKSVAIGDMGRPIVYQTSNGMVTGTTPLRGACDINQFFIYGGQLIAPSYCDSNGDVLIYDYPSGGTPVKRLTVHTFPFGAVVSK
jgi:hypothetical protein